MILAVLMTCHNRRVKTLRCLDCLFACELPQNVMFDIWLVDDGSTDGTGIDVSVVGQNKKTNGWRGEIHIIQGPGNLFWCGGMRLAWSAASGAKDYDGYLWLNDDTFLFPDALKLLLGGDAGVNVGATCDSERRRVTYGGRNQKGGLVIPNGMPQEVRVMNGNCVYVPRKIFQSVGSFPVYFTHALGDYDYGLRARKAGFGLLLTRRYVGVCEDKNPTVTWVDPAASFVRRVRNLYSAKGSATPFVFFRFNLAHYGCFRAVRLFVLQHVRLCFPKIWEQEESHG